MAACEESAVGDGEQEQEMKTFCQLIRSKYTNDKLWPIFLFNYLKEEM